MAANPDRPAEAVPQFSSLVDLLRHRAINQPQQKAYTFLLDGESDEAHITYEALDRRARAIGCMLQSLDAAGQRALLLYPPGLEFTSAFWGCLYAGVVAVPAYPPHPSRINRSLAQLRSIITDAQCGLVLSNSQILSTFENLVSGSLGAHEIRCLATDALPHSLAEEWQAPPVAIDTLAFLQYTSGSTSKPKGVMLTHSHLLHNSAQIYRAFGHSSQSRGVIWLPPYHDMGLIGGVLQPAYGGFPVTLMSPYNFLQRPLRWLQAISNTRATTSGGPNFAYELCVRKITSEQREALDLSCWELAFNGAEPIRSATLERFAEAFRPCGFRAEAFYPCYGLAEATLIVTGGMKGAPPVLFELGNSSLQQNKIVREDDRNSDLQTLVGCGQPAADQRIMIVDPETFIPCAAGGVGEIWVSGPSVAAGYWNRPEETERDFRAHTADSQEGPYMRTGDLGFILDGELFVTGRLKDLIILVGRNLYPQDLETTVEASHPGLRAGCAAAFSVDVAGQEQLIVAQEIDRNYRNSDLAEVFSAIRKALAVNHDVRPYAVVLLKPGKLPKTSSGKIQRYLCRIKFLEGTLDAIEQNVKPTG